LKTANSFNSDVVPSPVAAAAYPYITAHCAWAPDDTINDINLHPKTDE